jgi:hypothetical protein
MTPEDLAKRLNALEQQFPRLLRCGQCGKTSDEKARGWQAWLPENDDTTRDETIASHCPHCVERVFDD